MKNFSLLRRQNLSYGKILSANCRAQIQNGSQISLETDAQEPRMQAELSIELPEAAFFNGFQFNSQTASLVFSIHVQLRTGQWTRVHPVSVDREGETYMVFLPLLQAGKIQLIFFKKDRAQMGKMSIAGLSFFSGVTPAIAATSQLDRLWVPDNLVDGRPDYGWASKADSKQDTIQIDLKSDFYLSEFRMKSVNESPNFFPGEFTLYSAITPGSWAPVLSESDFLVFSDSWYSWLFYPVKCRYLKLEIRKASGEPVRILEMDALAVAENAYSYFLSGNSGHALASEMIAGSVIFAEDKSTALNKAVQASDSRLRPATAEFPGIVRLARNGEAAEGAAVQGDDRRLNKSSVSSPGIVQLAKNGESKAGTAVQGDDSRLQSATVEKSGIVKLAASGDTKPGVVIQGNDSRLKAATEDSPGIVRLSADGESKPGTAVQASDSRLREASTSWVGLVQLAGHGEAAPGKALQADDPRLLDGTTERKGRVMLARDQESSAEKALSSGDSRLNKASEEAEGIVRFAGAGKKIPEAAVRADDPRLEDARKPLPHQHTYAAEVHDMNSHSGSLNLRINKATAPLSDDGGDLNLLPLSVINEEGVAAGFKGGVVIRADGDAALKVRSKGAGGEMVAVKGAALSALSENDFAVRLVSGVSGMKSSGKSLLADGLVQFQGQTIISSEGSLNVSWAKFSSESFADGDLITVNADGVIEKVKSPGQTVIGIVNSKAQMILDKAAGGRKIVFAIAGICQVRIAGQVDAGKMLAYNGGNPGVAKQVDAAHKGGHAAVALESWNGSGEKVIWCLLA